MTETASAVIDDAVAQMSHAHATKLKQSLQRSIPTGIDLNRKGHIMKTSAEKRPTLLSIRMALINAHFDQKVKSSKAQK